MKPSWNDAPEWANWVAMDDLGDWYWHECKPQKGRAGFYSGVGSRVKKVCLEINWEESLEPRAAGE